MIRPARWGLVAACLVAAACTTSPDTGDVVAAPPGAVQPDGNGQALGESKACQEYTDALKAASDKLHCGAASYSCPEYIRPAGGQACLQYDQGSVSACADLIKKYASCDDFHTQPCIVTVLPGTAPAGCPDGGGMGGSDGGGTGGSGGTSGASGSGGTGGTGGASDAGTG